MVDTHPMVTLRVVQRRALLIAAGAAAALLVLACVLAVDRHASANRAASLSASESSPPAIAVTQERDSFASATSGTPTVHGQAESSAEVPTIEIEDEPVAVKAVPRKSARRPTVWSSIKRFFSKRS